MNGLKTVCGIDVRPAHRHGGADRAGEDAAESEKPRSLTRRGRGRRGGGALLVGADAAQREAQMLWLTRPGQADRQDGQHRRTTTRPVTHSSDGAVGHDATDGAASPFSHRYGVPDQLSQAEGEDGEVGAAQMQHRDPMSAANSAATAPPQER